MSALSPKLDFPILDMARAWDLGLGLVHFKTNIDLRSGNGTAIKIFTMITDDKRGRDDTS